ncbi:MAG TPA: flagellar basal body P-ring formation chaperone FlgA [Burkholderiaceae bacterium]|jgi:flagella basal body P-ring formation protein FlgA
MKKLIKTASFILLYALTYCLLASTADAQPSQPAGPLQDHEKMRQLAEQFLRAQAATLPGDVSVTIGAIDPHLQLAACDIPEAFLPLGSRAWGKTSVGVRCKLPMPWTVYIPATVHVMSDYIVTNTPLSQGKIISQNDIKKQRGDLAALPAGTLTDSAQAIGHTAAISLSSGMPLRQSALRNQQAVQQGQIVRLVSIGPGFSISAEAKAMTAGNEGQMVQAKTPSGQIVNGIAKLGGVVEVAY